MKVRDDVKDYFSSMRRCTKCVLPETFPGIEFDNEGVCNYCKSYEPMNPLGEDAFIKLLSKYRGKGKEYDVLVPISGGRDSSYVVHQMVKKYNMRVIGVTVDSGFTCEEGWRNIRVLVEKLNIPYVILRNEEKIIRAKKNTKIKFNGWLKQPSINMIIPVLNAGDKTMNYQMYQYAVDNNISLMLGGNVVGNAKVEQNNWKTGFMGIFPNDRGIYTTKDKIRLIFHYGLEFVKNKYNFRLPIISEYFSGTITFFFDKLRKPKNLNNIGFYDYIYWDEKKILDTIIKELDWKGADDTETTWRIDDTAYPLINYIMYNLVGFTEHDEMYSRMIREEQTTRSKALERLEDDHKPRWIKLEKDFEEFEITKDELNRALEKYRDKLISKRL